MGIHAFESFTIAFLCSIGALASHASDILYDGYRDALAQQKSLSASDAERIKTDAMLDFAKAFSFHIFNGTAPLHAADKILAALERDPESEQLISFYINMFKKSPDRPAARKKLYELSNRHPEAWILHLTVAEILIADKKGDDALRHLKLAFEQGVQPASKHDNPGKERLRLAILSKYLFLSYMNKEKADFEIVESFLKNDPYYKNSPRVVSNLLILASAKIENAPPLALTPFGPVPDHSLELREEFHRAALRFIEKVRAGEMPPSQDRTAGVNILFRSALCAEMEKALNANLVKNPKEIDTHLRLADLAKQRGNGSLAARHLETASAIETPPPFVVLHELFSIYVDSLKDYNLALRTLDRMRERVPHEKLVPLYVLVYRKRGEPGKALQCIRELPESFPRFLQETLFLYDMKDLKGAYEAGGKAFAELQEKKLELQNDIFFFLYAELAEKQKDLKTVTALMEILIQKNRKNHIAKNFLGYVLADHNIELEKAHTLIEDALREKPDDPAYLDSMAWVLYRMKKFPQAKEYILKSMKNCKKDDAVMLDHAGDIHFALDEKNAAREFWQRALQTTGEIDRDAIRKKLRDAETSPVIKP